MKNTVISVICLSLVFVYSIFTFFYIKNFKVQMESCLPYAETTITAKDCENIEKIYRTKKDVLRFILNNEYTDSMEEIIISLCNAVDFDDEEDTAQNILLLKNILDDIMHQNSCIL